VQRQVAPPVQPESTPIPTSLGQSDSEVAIDLKQTKKSPKQSKNRKKIESIDEVDELQLRFAQSNIKSLKRKNRGHSAEKENPNAHKAVKSRKTGRVKDESAKSSKSKGLVSRDLNMRSSSDLSTQLNSITAVNKLEGNPKADSSNLSSNSVNQLSAQSHLSSTIVNSSSNNSFNKLEMPNIELNKTKVDFGKIAEGCRDATKFCVTLTNPGILSQQTVSGASLLIELDDCSEWVVHRHGKTSQTDSLSKYDELKLQLAKSLSLNANGQLKYEQVLANKNLTKQHFFNHPSNYYFKYPSNHYFNQHFNYLSNQHFNHNYNQYYLS
jgi:hypothetical protein